MIENNNNNRICDTCSKEDVCMYKEELAKVIRDITQISDRKNVFVDTDVKCKKWLGKVFNYRQNGDFKRFIMNEYTINKASSLEVSVEKFLEAVKQFSEHIYDATEIFMGNPFDLIRIDMSEIPRNCYFISDSSIERNKMYHITDSELKRMLYDFIEKYPNRVFRGEK